MVFRHGGCWLFVWLLEGCPAQCPAGTWLHLSFLQPELSAELGSSPNLQGGEALTVSLNNRSHYRLYRQWDGIEISKWTRGHRKWTARCSPSLRWSKRERVFVVIVAVFRSQCLSDGRPGSALITGTLQWDRCTYENTRGLCGLPVTDRGLREWLCSLEEPLPGRLRLLGWGRPGLGRFRRSDWLQDHIQRGWRHRRGARGRLGLAGSVKTHSWTGGSVFDGGLGGGRRFATVLVGVTDKSVWILPRFVASRMKDAGAVAASGGSLLAWNNECNKTVHGGKSINEYWFNPHLKQLLW